jgi:hypothetical protein
MFGCGQHEDCRNSGALSGELTMDRDFNLAYLEGKLAGLDAALLWIHSESKDRSTIQEMRREVQEVLDKLKES